MQLSKKYDYDVAIIGAGISGLVCGCYLAKAGLKTLIVEKNANVGGYCTSFARKGFHFDSCVHALSSLREGGLLNKILGELGVTDKLKFNRHNPSDIVITPEFKINIFYEVERTIEEFQKYFPKEKDNISKFFKYISSGSFLEIRVKTFEQLLDSFFEDKKLKAIFSIIMMQVLGLPPFQLSAIVACLLYREFIFDGGYYPEGGMQDFSDVLAKRFIELQGCIISSKRVKKIKIDKNVVESVVLEDGQYITSKIIVAACDARQTFFELIGQDKISKYFVSKINTRVVSSSGFFVYLGIDKEERVPCLEANIYLITNYNIEKVWANFLNCKVDHLIIASSSARDNSLSDINNKMSILIGTNMAYKDEDYWKDEKNKEKIANRLIKIAKQTNPDLFTSIAVRILATPLTLYKWTGNYHGAAFGWASTPEQFGDPDFSQKTMIENLYLAGHWSNQSSGVSFVANCGRGTAELILRRGKIT